MKTYEQYLDESPKSIVLQKFMKLGNDASYHYADDSGGEWGTAKDLQKQAMELYFANPQYQKEMDRIAKNFLWYYDFKLDKKKGKM